MVESICKTSQIKFAATVFWLMLVDIKSLTMLEGNLPRRALNFILDWAELHQAELLTDWELCTQKKTPNKIEP